MNIDWEKQLSETFDDLLNFSKYVLDALLHGDLFNGLVKIAPNLPDIIRNSRNPITTSAILFSLGMLCYIFKKKKKNSSDDKSSDNDDSFKWSDLNFIPVLYTLRLIKKQTKLIIEEVVVGSFTFKMKEVAMSIVDMARDIAMHLIGVFKRICVNAIDGAEASALRLVKLIRNIILRALGFCEFTYHQLVTLTGKLYRIIIKSAELITTWTIEFICGLYKQILLNLWKSPSRLLRIMGVSEEYLKFTAAGDKGRKLNILSSIIVTTAFSCVGAYIITYTATQKHEFAVVAAVMWASFIFIFESMIASDLRDKKRWVQPDTPLPASDKKPESHPYVPAALLLKAVQGIGALLWKLKLSLGVFGSGLFFGRAVISLIMGFLIADPIVAKLFETRVKHELKLMNESKNEGSDSVNKNVRSNNEIEIDKDNKKITDIETKIGILNNVIKFLVKDMETIRNFAEDVKDNPKRESDYIYHYYKNNKPKIFESGTQEIDKDYKEIGEEIQKLSQKWSEVEKNDVNISEGLNKNASQEEVKDTSTPRIPYELADDITVRYTVKPKAGKTESFQKGRIMTPASGCQDICRTLKEQAKERHNHAVGSLTSLKNSLSALLERVRSKKQEEEGKKEHTEAHRDKIREIIEEDKKNLIEKDTLGHTEAMINLAFKSKIAGLKMLAVASLLFCIDLLTLIMKYTLIARTYELAEKADMQIKEMHINADINSHAQTTGNPAPPPPPPSGDSEKRG